MNRPPAVAGTFYPASPDVLRRDVERYMSHPSQATQSLGVIVPHAGYVYSGETAGKVFAATVLPRRFIVLCPKHYAGGSDMAIWSAGAWDTPLGPYPIDSELAALLKHHAPQLQEDHVPHSQEHSLEVQLPFLQSARPDGAFVPIALGPIGWTEIQALGSGIAAALQTMPESEHPLVVASSDMNHYEDEATTMAKDERALAAVTAMDPRGLLRVCRDEHVSMCGVIPASVMMVITAALGASRARVLEHTTSAKVSGDTNRVVGYAGVQVQ
jgi:AmmeMemoRadiSam system protein B